MLAYLAPQRAGEAGCWAWTASLHSGARATRMFQSISDMIPADADCSARARRLDVMRRVLDGTLYDVLPYEFHEERSASGE